MGLPAQLFRLLKNKLNSLLQSALYSGLLPKPGSYLPTSFLYVVISVSWPRTHRCRPGLAVLSVLAQPGHTVSGTCVWVSMTSVGEGGVRGSSTPKLLTPGLMEALLGRWRREFMVCVVKINQQQQQNSPHAPVLLYKAMWRGLQHMRGPVKKSSPFGRRNCRKIYEGFVCMCVCVSCASTASTITDVFAHLLSALVL